MCSGIYKNNISVNVEYKSQIFIARVIKNVRSSTSYKKNSVCRNLRKFFLTHSFMKGF